jgi:diguanylate cyclase (GGDEF)-like protein
MEDSIRNAVLDPKNDGRPIPIFILDIDEFKHVNDSFGHHAGDTLIREVARILKENVAPTALVSRWGGDEFLAACPDCSFDSVRKLAERFRATLEGAAFPYDDGIIKTTVSIGVARVGRDFEKGYREADRALYAAKAAGKNRVMIHEHE